MIACIGSLDGCRLIRLCERLLVGRIRRDVAVWLCGWVSESVVGAVSVSAFVCGRGCTWGVEVVWVCGRGVCGGVRSPMHVTRDVGA